MFISANRTLAFALAAATLSIDSGAILTDGAFNLTVSGDAVNTTIGGSLTATTGAVSVSGNLTVQTVTVGAGGLAVIGLLDTASLTTGVGAGTVDMNGDFTVTGTYSATDGTTFMGGVFSVGTLIANGGLIVFDGTAGTTIGAAAFGRADLGEQDDGRGLDRRKPPDRCGRYAHDRRQLDLGNPGRDHGKWILLASGQTVGSVTSAGDIVGHGNGDRRGGQNRHERKPVGGDL